MIPGQRYFNGDVVLGDWFPRRGDNRIYRAELVDQHIASPNGETLTITVLTKNADDTGEGTAISGHSISIIATSNQFQEDMIISTTLASETGLKELVRFKFAFAGGSAGDWFLVRMLPSVFFDNADGTAT